MATNIPRSKIKDATQEMGINSSENKAGAVEMLFYISLNCERQQFVFYQPASKNISGGGWRLLARKLRYSLFSKLNFPAGSDRSNEDILFNGIALTPKITNKGRKRVSIHGVGSAKR